MRISDRYIGKQVLLGTLYAVAVLGIVLVFGKLFQEIRPLLVEKHAPLLLVLKFVITVLPLSLMYTVPWGFLSAVLLVFGKLSSNQEITSFRVAGLSLARLSAPVFVIGALLSGASLWLNLNVVPYSKATLAQLLIEQVSTDPQSLLKPGVTQGNFEPDGDDIKQVLVEGKSGGWVEGFHFYQLPLPGKGKGDSQNYIHARRAAISVNPEKTQLILKLEDAYFESRKENGEMDSAFAGQAEPLLLDLKSSKSRKFRQNAMSNEEIRAEIANNPSLTAKKRVALQAEITRRYSFSMACFAFAFVAVPLGLNARRRDTSGGLIISLAIGAIYFLITVMVDQFKTDTAATAVLWAPNIACVLLGLFLFRRARFK